MLNSILVIFHVLTDRRFSLFYPPPPYLKLVCNNLLLTLLIFSLWSLRNILCFILFIFSHPLYVKFCFGNLPCANRSSIFRFFFFTPSLYILHITKLISLFVDLYLFMFFLRIVLSFIATGSLFIST